MTAPDITDFIEGPVIRGDPVLGSLLLEAVNQNSCVLYACNMVRRQMLYISPACTEMLGYPPERFIEGGAEFFYTITDPDVIPDIVKRQLHYTGLSKVPGFNPSAVIIQRYPVIMITADNQKKKVASRAVVLSYNSDGEWEDGVAMLIKGDKKVKEQCVAILKAIKRRHNEIYIHQPIVASKEVLPVVHIMNDRIDKTITHREAQVIKLLADGHSTRLIAALLKITPNTCETYRKHLLQKLDAKNTAELIKKASKVFWLE